MAWSTKTEVRVREVEMSTGRGADGFTVQITAARALPGYFIDDGDINPVDIPEDFRQALIAWLMRAPKAAEIEQSGKEIES